MIKPLPPSLPILLAYTTSTLSLIIAPVALGWIPRLSTSCIHKNALLLARCAGVRTTSQSSLWMGNERQDKGGLDNDNGGDEDYVHEEVLSRLEAIYGMDTDSHMDYTKGGKTRQALWQEPGEERVVLGDWMELAAEPCLGDCCGDECDQCDIPEEYKEVTSTKGETPKVDVMAFLGIRRAEPLRVSRDWD